MIHADGHGTPPVKMSTWDRLITDLQPGIWMGWKNFYTEGSSALHRSRRWRCDPPWFVSLSVMALKPDFIPAIRRGKLIQV